MLHLIYSPAYGGIEHNVINWVRYFDRSAFDIHVACFTGDRDREIPFMRAAEAAGIPVFPVPWTKFKPFLRCAREVARLARELQIDIVHTHAYYGDAVGAIAGFLAPVKTIATVYVWGRYELHRQIMHVIDWTAIQFMDKVTAHCKDTARKTFVLGTPRKKIPILIPGYENKEQPLTPRERLERRRAAGIADDEVFLLNAARLAPEKAQDQLLQAFRAVADKYPKARLWICGVGLESIETQLRNLIRDLQLESVAKLVGFRADYWETLNMADIMVHPAHVEGMPLALLGAMAAGLPIVASAVGGIPEIIEHAKTGMIAKENDVAGFTRCVLELMDDPARARAMGLAAQARVRTELSIEEAVRKVEGVYHNMLGLQSHT